MTIIDRNTGIEIKPNSYRRVSGTDRIIECLLNGTNIIDIIFGTTSRGIIDWKEIPSEVIFNNCTFNYVTFKTVSNCTFKNCYFKKCEFYSMKDVILENCTGISSELYNSDDLFMLLGNCSFTDCSGLTFMGQIDPNAIIKSTNCPNLNKALDKVEQFKKYIEDKKRESNELRKYIKYGYKVVNAPVLVKLSFPDEADIINLDRDKSRASMAFVEDVYPINYFEGKGVTNTEYEPFCNYEVGKIVYPDSFNINPDEECGHGIHFCKDIENLTKYACLNSDQIKSIKKMLNM
jgi:hypothetical protein